MKPTLAFALLPLVVALPAAADIWRWTDRNGVVHLSNLAPPEDARVQSVTRSAPRDPEREAAAREAARHAEVRALDERVRQLTYELEQSRREPPPPPVVVVAPPAYAPPPAPYIVNVVTQSAPAAGGCDSGWGNCGFGWWSGFVPVVTQPVDPWPPRGKHPRRGGPGYAFDNTQIVPPLIPRPPRHGPRRG
jgi:hypothetical protein